MIRYNNRCVKITSLDGSVRYVAMSRPFKRTEGDVVSIQINCNAEEIEVTPNDLLETLQVTSAVRYSDKVKTDARELDKEIGPGFGNLLKRMASPIANLLGKTDCTLCETRRIVTNAYRKLKAKHGQVEALRIIKELWEMSFEKGETGQKVLDKLQEYLKGEDIRA